MTRTTIQSIQNRYGRLLLALAIVAGGIGIGLTAQPQAVTAKPLPASIPAQNDDRFDEVPFEAVSFEETTDFTSPKNDLDVVTNTIVDPFQSILRFGEVYVIFSHHPIQERSCWTVHNLQGEVLGAYADQTAVESIFPQVDSDELLFAALRNGN